MFNIVYNYFLFTKKYIYYYYFRKIRGFITFSNELKLINLRSLKSKFFIVLTFNNVLFLLEKYIILY